MSTLLGMADDCSARRRDATLIWVPVLSGIPLFHLHGGTAQVGLQVALLVLLAATALVTVFTERRAALAALGLVTLLAATQGAGFQTSWGLLAIVAPLVLRRWLLVLAIGTAGAGVGIASVLHHGYSSTIWLGVGGTLLAGASTTSFVRLIETNAALRRTRAELARAAVAEERERFSRDLHDLLGHTLSVMVVKAQAVRRLAGLDPEAVAEHAADIEQIGRKGLTDVRRAVDGMRAPSLVEELDGARRALAAAGIEAIVTAEERELPADVDQTLAWVVRESATNVIRHSGAEKVRFELRNGDGQLRLTVADDGVGGPTSPNGAREGGLDGLRRRVVAQGGDLDVRPDADGFTLTARIPAR